MRYLGLNQIRSSEFFDQRHISTISEMSNMLKSISAEAYFRLRMQFGQPVITPSTRNGSISPLIFESAIFSAKSLSYIQRPPPAPQHTACSLLRIGSFNSNLGMDPSTFLGGSNTLQCLPRSHGSCQTNVPPFFLKWRRSSEMRDSIN